MLGVWKKASPGLSGSCILLVSVMFATSLLILSITLFELTLQSSSLPPTPSLSVLWQRPTGAIKGRSSSVRDIEVTPSQPDIVLESGEKITSRVLMNTLQKYFEENCPEKASGTESTINSYHGHEAELTKELEQQYHKKIDILRDSYSVTLNPMAESRVTTRTSDA